jgi:hypothetical protein
MVLELIATALPTVIKNALLGIVLGVVLVVGYYILKRQGHDLLASFKARSKVSPAVQVATQGTQKIPIRITQASEDRVVLVLGGVRLTVEAIQDEG